AERRRRHMAGEMRQRGDADLAADRRAGALEESGGVRPVPQEHGAAASENMARRLLGRRRYQLGTDAAGHERVDERERAAVLGALEDRLPVAKHVAAGAPEVLEDVAHEPLVLLALPDESVEAGYPGTQVQRDVRELVPGARRGEAVRRE